VHIVKNCHMMAFVQEPFNEVAADEPATSCYNCFHKQISPQSHIYFCLQDFSDSLTSSSSVITSISMRSGFTVSRTAAALTIVFTGTMLL